MSGLSHVSYHEEDDIFSQTIVGLNGSGFSVRDVPEIENVENLLAISARMDTEGRRDHKLILSSSPNNPDCVVMLADFNNQRVHFCNLGSEQSWISHDCNKNLGEEDALNNVIRLNGKFYGITLRKNLVLIHTAPCPETSFVRVERPELLPGICASVESHG
ncbi:uncharacterized protein A4U43_C10F18250 [Asparagus officinalis]|uniref:KIB1-4 beta-propeller domain-containing protein n=1 Tax=Asparagus officinalis TaxID=4686 RepID=A0A5P1E3Y5_ASPOF|nr:uncharacterized protein A4U43_C10F18250 [Asparagus officinalis]